MVFRRAATKERGDPEVVHGVTRSLQLNSGTAPRLGQDDPLIRYSPSYYCSEPHPFWRGDPKYEQQQREQATDGP